MDEHPQGGNVTAPTQDELRELFLFADLTLEQLDWIAGHSDVVAVPAGHELVTEGEPAECFYVLLSGTLVRK